MTTLLNNELSSRPLKEDKSERITFVDKFAVYFIGFVTVAALLIGGWSGIILLAGKTNNGGPLSYFVNLLQIVGVL